MPDGFYPMVVMIAIQNKKGEFLMQKRVPRKGGDWGVTGGHPKAGQTCEEGIITEVQEELGINDEEILKAILHHTTGNPNMSKLEELIFVADAVDHNF